MLAYKTPLKWPDKLLQNQKGRGKNSFFFKDLRILKCLSENMYIVAVTMEKVIPSAKRFFKSGSVMNPIRKCLYLCNGHKSSGEGEDGQPGKDPSESVKICENQSIKYI